MAGQLLRHLCCGFLRILVPLPVPGAGPEPCLCRPHLPVSSSHVEPLIPFPVTLSSRMHLLRSWSQACLGSASHSPVPPRPSEAQGDSYPEGASPSSLVP